MKLWIAAGTGTVCVCVSIDISNYRSAWGNTHTHAYTHLQACAAQFSSCLRRRQWRSGGGVERERLLFFYIFPGVHCDPLKRVRAWLKRKREREGERGGKLKRGRGGEGSALPISLLGQFNAVAHHPRLDATILPIPCLFPILPHSLSLSIFWLKAQLII